MKNPNIHDQQNLHGRRYVSAVSTLWAANPAVAQDSETIRELKSQVQELDQKLRVVERRLELEREASSEKSKSTPVISVGAGGFSFRSADTNFVLKLRGYVAQPFRNTDNAALKGLGLGLINWENDILLIAKKEHVGKYEVIYPSVSILAEPTVSIVDKTVDKRGTRGIAEAYLQFLYSDEGQEIAAKNFYRAQSPKVLEKYAAQFPKVELFTIDDVFGGWQKAQKTHFNDGGTFDAIYQGAK